MAPPNDPSFITLRAPSDFREAQKILLRLCCGLGLNMEKTIQAMAALRETVAAASCCGEKPLRIEVQPIRRTFGIGVRFKVQSLEPAGQ